MCACPSTTPVPTTAASYGSITLHGLSPMMYWSSESGGFPPSLSHTWATNSGVRKTPPKSSGPVT